MEAGGYATLDKTETLRDYICLMTKMCQNDLPLVHTDQWCQLMCVIVCVVAVLAAMGQGLAEEKY
ncbi:hypothetical protein PAXRUDRAFT_828937 [Paxillus rubicundulus Ve08.2h10]|uniref:Unplaced genomic scaffold scaffold_359, whole genome shotgun sequence n=1 Tax=Paxillus rubicundulus Ve08.2h10 TaxID=930991 RepID=A0A0D0DNP9_9AGAM|nr:hypothetical protein PAXRUDRAFT_828937 [Paxillus rubicundulus Ve08.2h10]